MRYLVTGTAGFIGFYVAKRLLDAGHFVTGFDGMTKYYDVSLKEKRHATLSRSNGFRAEIGMLEDTDALKRAADAAEPEIIIHLAAQAGVRYSLENPRAYIDSNLIGSFNMLELARSLKIKHLMLASTSSIYGANEKIPFAESDKADDALRSHQKIHGIDGAQLRPSAQAADHRLPFLHRLWPVGTTGHGADQIR